MVPCCKSFSFRLSRSSVNFCFCTLLLAFDKHKTCVEDMPQSLPHTENPSKCTSMGNFADPLLLYFFN
jgi:hypothetical protein